MWPKCSLNVARMWPKCGPNVARMWPECGPNLARMWPEMNPWKFHVARAQPGPKPDTHHEKSGPTHP